ncbi:MAG: hypothetical protein U9Q15_01640 [Patescibacteria group bacterium]|nr:hypothetical protein [Patescibacteria group bacterium]
MDWIGQVLYQAEVGATDGDSTTDPDEYMASAIADKLSELEDADLDESVSIDNPLDTYLEALRGVYKETDTQVIELDGHTGVGFVTPEQQMTKYIADVLTLGYESKKVIGGLFIGDIPLPLVQRDGGLDRSAFPYSDVANRYYEYEEDLEYWTQDQYQSEKNAEIWSAFMLSDDSTGRELIRYFHRLLYLYAYAPNNGAATQQDSLDMYREKHMVQRNEFLDSISSPLQGDHDQGSFALFDISGMERAVQTDQYGKYQFFIDHQDDVLYDRVNKKMKADITGEDISFVKNTMSMRDRVVNTPLMQFCVDNAYPNCSLSEPAVATYCSENAIADADCDAEPVDPYNFFTDAPEVPAELAEVQKNMGEQLDTMYQYEMDIETLDTQNKFLVRFLQMFGGEFMGDSYEKVEGLGRYERDDIYDPAYLISAVDAMIGRELKEIDGFFENMFDTLFFDDLGRWDQDIPVTTGIDQQIYSGSDIWQEREQYYNSYPLSFIAYTG